MVGRGYSGGDEPAIWFDDLLRADGRPYDEAEIPSLKDLSPAQLHSQLFGVHDVAGR